jgi:hypothetical protein
MVEFYLYKGRRYSDMPAHTEIKSSNVIDGVVVHTVKRYSYLPHMIVLLAIVLMLVMTINVPRTNHVITYNTSMSFRDSSIAVNMFNSAENSYPISLRLYQDGMPVIDTIVLNPGEDVGSVQLLHDIDKASSMAQLEYTIEAGWRSVVGNYDVLLVKD